MKITKVRVTMAKTQSKNLMAFADITFDDAFVVTSLRVINGKNGLFVAMPSRKRDDGSWQDIAHPITADFRREINEAVLGMYQAECAGPDGAAASEIGAPTPPEDMDLPF